MPVPPLLPPPPPPLLPEVPLPACCFIKRSPPRVHDGVLLPLGLLLGLLLLLLLLLSPPPLLLPSATPSPQIGPEAAARRRKLRRRCSSSSRLAATCATCATSAPAASAAETAAVASLSTRGTDGGTPVATNVLRSRKSSVPCVPWTLMVCSSLATGASTSTSTEQSVDVVCGAAPPAPGRTVESSAHPNSPPLARKRWPTAVAVVADHCVGGSIPAVAPAAPAATPAAPAAAVATPAAPAAVIPLPPAAAAIAASEGGTMVEAAGKCGADPATPTRRIVPQPKRCTAISVSATMLRTSAATADDDEEEDGEGDGDEVKRDAAASNSEEEEVPRAEEGGGGGGRGGMRRVTSTRRTRPMPPPSPLPPSSPLPCGGSPAATCRRARRSSSAQTLSRTRGVSTAKGMDAAAEAEEEEEEEEEETGDGEVEGDDEGENRPPPPPPPPVVVVVVVVVVGRHASTWATLREGPNVMTRPAGGSAGTVTACEPWPPDSTDGIPAANPAAPAALAPPAVSGAAPPADAFHLSSAPPPRRWLAIISRDHRANQKGEGQQLRSNSATVSCSPVQ